MSRAACGSRATAIRRLLFCENETQHASGSGATPSSTAYPKDGINDHVVSGAATVNPGADRHEGRARLHRDARGRREHGHPSATERRHEGHPEGGARRPRSMPRSRRGKPRPTSSGHPRTAATADATEAQIVRQAMSGLLWSKQFYHFDIQRWLAGDPAFPPPPPERAAVRNAEWRHLNAHDVILMPDTWEYPWFAAWDLAFHCVTLAHIDPEFAKAQLVLILREWYMHPIGQLPAYEWNFADVNPPTHAWAALQVFAIDGERDFTFLARVFHKLLMNFTWWTNNKEDGDSNLFDGGFMGLDNIAPLDRSTLPPSIGTLEQADSTAWMATYALDLLHIALLLAAPRRRLRGCRREVRRALPADRRVGQRVRHVGRDGCVLLRHPAPGDGRGCSAQGALAGRARAGRRVARLRRRRSSTTCRTSADRLQWFIDSNPEYAASVFPRIAATRGRDHLMALVSPERLVRILSQVFDESGMLSPHGIRGISAYHRDHPFVVEVDRASASVDYEPAESTTGLFGGNSNWRGPVWFPLNVLLIEALRAYDTHAPGDVTVEFPLGSGQLIAAGCRGRRAVGSAHLAVPARDRQRRRARRIRGPRPACPLSAALRRPAVEVAPALLRVLRRRHGRGPRRLTPDRVDGARRAPDPAQVTPHQP